MSNDEINNYLVRLEKEEEEFKTELLRISWYMRGGVSYDALLHTYSAADRKCMRAVISENIQATKDTGKVLL